MDVTLIFLLCGVAVTQIIPALLFKMGSKYAGGSRRFIFFFLGGNLVGSTSMLFAMKLFGIFEHNANLASVLLSGISFLSVQIFLGIIYRRELSFNKIFGIILASAGLFICMLYAPTA